MDDLTSFQRDLLVVTAGLEAPNGLAIKAVSDRLNGNERFRAASK